ncbi:MAG: efflux RND transporter permease subunit, partial [Alphaproteobacteria bacterium]
ATLIPLIAVPVSLIGTFAGMYILGFSINLLTLFGMILAIGIVVDDAIIVIENIERIMREEGLRAREAAIKAMEEVSGPVIAIVLVLCAVFLPVAFISGLAGTIYKQFAITIIIAVILSGLVALTLTPALCAHFIEYKHHDNYFFNKFNNWFGRLTAKYISGVKYFLNNKFIAFLAFMSVIALVIVMFLRLPTSLVPDEDQGYIVTAQMLMPGASIDRTVNVIDDFTSHIIKDPAVEHVISLAGFDLIGGSGLKSSAGAAFVKFKDWAFRTKPSEDSKALAGKFMGIGAATNKDAIILAFNPPAITGMSTTGGFDAYILYKGSETNFTDSISNAINKFLETAKKRPELSGLQSTFSASVPMYKIILDKTKTKALNINISDVFNVMQTTFGTAYINDFTLYGRTYKVLMQSDSEFRERIDNLKDVFVRSKTGKMVSIDSLLKIEPIVGLNNLDRFNIFPAARIMGSPAIGYSSGQALNAMEEAAKESLSEEFSLAWTGSAYQEKASGNTGIIAFIIGIIMVFLILAALYERWSLPIAVVASVPFAVFGAVIFQSLRGLANDVYFQVGLVTLIGLSAKNAILIVEFAFLEYKKGVPAIDAALNAARLRFRPIIMTSLAFILGCVPLYFSSGAGSASRHSIGTGIIGGMLAATFIATLFIPLFFKVVSNFSKSKDIKAEKEPIYD